MRGERATLGKSLLDVQRELKIKANYISAIEDADPSAFESKGFIAGYVRSYARYLGLDPEESFRRFCIESGFETPRGPAATSKAATEALKSAPKTSKKSDPLLDGKAAFTPSRGGFLAHIDLGAIGPSLILVALVTALGYGGWTVLKQVQQVNLAPVEQAPGVIASLGAPMIAPTEPVMSEAEREAALVRLYRPQALDVPVLEARDGPISTLDPSAIGVLAAEQEQLRQIAQDALPQFPDDEPVAETVQVLEAAAPELAILAADPAWVRVSAADGSVLFEKIMEVGERYVVPATETPPILRAGNSGSIYFAVNGETYGPAGVGGAVAKNVELSAVSLQEVYEMTDLASDPDMAAIVALAKAPITTSE